MYYRGQLTPKSPVFNHYYVHTPPRFNNEMTLTLTLTYPKTDPNLKNLTEFTTKRKGAGLTSNPLIHPLKQECQAPNTNLEKSRFLSRFSAHLHMRRPPIQPTLLKRVFARSQIKPKSNQNVLIVLERVFLSL